MMCREFREQLMEWARGAEPPAAVRDHAAVCGYCAAFLDRQRELTAALSAIEADPVPPARELAPRIMAEFDRAQRKPRAPVLAWPAAAILAAAASMVLFVSPNKPAPPPAQAQDSGQFLPIPYTVPLAPEERVSIVRMDIPVTALLAAGFRMPAADPAAVVQADVLVSQDGRARAIRPLSISNTD